VQIALAGRHLIVFVYIEAFGSRYASSARNPRTNWCTAPTVSGAIPVVSNEEGGPPPDDVNILTSIVEEGADVTGATLVDAYNKIKHRFTVIDDLQRLGRALKEGGRRGAYVRYPRAPAKADVLFMNIMTVAAAAGEIAALVAWLDELGVLPSGA
jgi:hypothetical protein